MLVQTVHQGLMKRWEPDGMPELRSVCGLRFVQLEHDGWGRLSCRNCKRILKKRKGK